MTSVFTIVVGHTWGCELGNKETSWPHLIHHCCLATIISGQREAPRVTGWSLQFISPLHSWGCKSLGKLRVPLQTECRSEPFIDQPTVRENTCAPPTTTTTLHEWKSNIYMWYFASGVALHDRWPIYCIGSLSLLWGASMPWRQQQQIQGKGKSVTGRSSCCRYKNEIKNAGVFPRVSWSCDAPQPRMIPWDDMPAGVLSHLCQFQHKAAAARTELTIKYLGLDLRGNSRATAATSLQKKKVGFIQNALERSKLKTHSTPWRNAYEPQPFCQYVSMLDVNEL